MAVRTAAGQVAAPSRRQPGLRPADAFVAVALAVAAAALRIGPLGTSSLWLDDAWTALVVRTHSWSQAADLAVTAPGFALLLRAWLTAVGFTETAAQLPALAFSVVCPPTIYLVAAAAGIRRVAAAVGGLLLLIAPAHLTFATRVKQYTLDALLAAALIGLAWRVIDAPADRRRWVWLVAGAAAATMLSAAVAPVVAGAFLAGLVAAWRDHARPVRLGLLAAATYGAMGLAWYLAVLRPSISPVLRAYWREEYIDTTAGPFEAAMDLWRGIAGLLEAFSGLPPTVTGITLAAAVVAVLVSRPALGLLLASPVAVAAILATLRLAPLGGGRTDIALLPGLALLAALAVDRAGAADRRAGAGLAVVAVAAGALTGPAPRPYPQHDVRPLVAEMEAALAPGDAVLVYSATRWAYGLYTRFEVAFPDDATQATGFDVAVSDRRVHILDPQRQHPQRYAPDLRDGTRGATRVWLLASGWREDLVVLEHLLSEQGLREVSRRARPGALLVRWER